MKKIFLPVLAIVVLIAACVPSVNPFYTDKDVVADPRIAGAWLQDESKDDPAAWKFEVTTNNAYAVNLKEDKGKTGSFEGHLFKLGQDTFLDLTPTECNFATNQASMVGVSMIPGHLLLRVQFTDKKMNLAFCNPDWVKIFLEQNPSAIAHRVVDGSVFLTADTGALQKFVQKHLGKDELFSDGTDYRRQADANGAK